MVYLFTPQILILTHQEPTAFENIVGKGEIARNEQFLLFPQCFLPYQISVSPFVHIFDIISLIAVELEESKFGISGKGLLPLDEICSRHSKSLLCNNFFTRSCLGYFVGFT